jgi:hypothetical protein
MKSEARNSKSLPTGRQAKQFRMTKALNSKLSSCPPVSSPHWGEGRVRGVLDIRTFEFGICFELRYSDFGFKIHKDGTTAQDWEV